MCLCLKMVCELFSLQLGVFYTQASAESILLCIFQASAKIILLCISGQCGEYLAMYTEVQESAISEYFGVLPTLV